jgi:hypothetical protein
MTFCLEKLMERRELGTASSWFFNALTNMNVIYNLIRLDYNMNYGYLRIWKEAVVTYFKIDYENVSAGIPNGYALKKI